LNTGFSDKVLQIPSAIFRQDSGFSEIEELVLADGSERNEQD
jgi:hypothetical protein